MAVRRGARKRAQIVIEAAYVRQLFLRSSPSDLTPMLAYQVVDPLIAIDLQAAEFLDLYDLGVELPFVDPPEKGQRPVFSSEQGLSAERLEFVAEPGILL